MPKQTLFKICRSLTQDYRHSLVENVFKDYPDKEWGDGSVGKVLIMQAGGPEFKSPISM